MHKNLRQRLDVSLLGMFSFDGVNLGWTHSNTDVVVTFTEASELRFNYESRTKTRLGDGNED